VTTLRILGGRRILGLGQGVLRLGCGVLRRRRDVLGGGPRIRVRRHGLARERVRRDHRRSNADLDRLGVGRRRVDGERAGADIRGRGHHVRGRHLDLGGARAHFDVHRLLGALLAVGGAERRAEGDDGRGGLGEGRRGRLRQRGRRDHGGGAAVHVDADPLSGDFEAILVEQHDRLPDGRFQRPAVAADPHRRRSLGAVEDQLVVAGNPQLAGGALVALPQHGAAAVDPQAGLPSDHRDAAQVAGAPRAGVQILEADRQRSRHRAPSFAAPAYRPAGRPLKPRRAARGTFTRYGSFG